MFATNFSRFPMHFFGPPRMSKARVSLRKKIYQSSQCLHPRQGALNNCVRTEVSITEQWEQSGVLRLVNIFLTHVNHVLRYVVNISKIIEINHI